MNRQYVRQQEEWTPISDWGRSMKPYLDEVKRNAIKVVRKPKFRGRRVLADRATREDRHCSLCQKVLKTHNKSGVCSGCYDRNRTIKKGPRPVCPGCGTSMTRKNTSGLCYRCMRVASVRKMAA